MMLLLWPWRKRDVISTLKPLSKDWSPTNIVSKEYVDARHKQVRPA